eukprot:438646-Pyramimonas_sp.AAC.1
MARASAGVAMPAKNFLGPHAPSEGNTNTPLRGVSSSSATPGGCSTTILSCSLTSTAGLPEASPLADRQR